MFACQEGAGQVDRERAFPEAEGEFMGPGVLADQLDRGTDIEHVEPGVTAAHLVEGGHHARLVADVGHEWKTGVAEVTRKTLD